MAEQFHQRIDAHVRVRELGGLGMAQSVHERTGDGLRVGAGAFEGHCHVVELAATGRIRE